MFVCARGILLYISSFVIEQVRYAGMLKVENVIVIYLGCRIVIKSNPSFDTSVIDISVIMASCGLRTGMVHNCM